MLENIKNIQFDLRKISDVTSGIDGIIRADIGDINIALPEEIIKISQNCILNEKYKYEKTFGNEKLISSIKEYEKNKIKNFKNPQVLVTTGAQAGLFASFVSVLKSGDEVIVNNAYYPPYKSLAQICNAKLITCDIKNQNELIKKITKNTKALILNSPNNPTGEILDKKTVEQIVEISNKNNLYIFSDDVYDRLNWTKEVFHSSKIYPEKTIVINSVSKSLCLTGVRIGWIIAEEENVVNLAKVHRNINSCPNSLSQNIIAEFLPISSGFLKEIRKILKNRLDVLKKKLSKKNSLELLEVDGGIYMFLKIKNLKDSEQYVFDLIKNKKISAIPGVYFGDKNYDKIRICFGNIKTEEIKNLAEKI